MSRAIDPDQAASSPDDGIPKSRNRRKPLVITALAAIGALVLAPQVLPASADPGVPADSGRVHLPKVAPPAGSAWIQGKLTDQAGHGLDNVNVEVWSDDPAATAPIASNLTYGGLPADGRHAHGAYRVEVPADKPYVLLFSAVNGAEDGDAYRMQSYGKGRPIMIRSTSAKALRGAGKAVAGVRDLGLTQLVHQGKVNSKVKVTHGKIKAGGKKEPVKITVTSPFVRDITGKLLIKVDGKKVRQTLNAADHGKESFKLKKLNKPGKYTVVATYKGSKTVKKAKSKPITITVK